MLAHACEALEQQYSHLNNMDNFFYIVLYLCSS